MAMVPFTGSSFRHKSKNVSPQYSLNLYSEFPENPDSTSDNILISIPGSVLLHDIADETGVTRGLYRATNGRVFGGWGSNIYEITLSGYTRISTISLGGSAPLSFTDNGLDLVICDGTNLYRWNFADELWTTISLPFSADFIPKTVITFQRRILLSGKASGVNPSISDIIWYYSDVDDVTSWNALQFYAAEAKLDSLTGFAVSQNSLYLIGNGSIEQWASTGIIDNPFQRIGYSLNTTGTLSPYSIVNVDDEIYFLGTSKVGGASFYKLNGTVGQRISDQSIEHELYNMVRKTGVSLSDCVAWSYEQEGHKFIIFNFISGNLTLCYDITTNLWHHRGTRDPFVNIVNRWYPIYGVMLGDDIVTAYGRGAQVLKLDLEIHTEYDPDFADNALPITVQRISPVYWSEMTQTQITEMRFLIETGVGVQENLRGFDPKALVRISKDGGYSFEPIQHEVSLGKTGNYAQECRLGNVFGMSRRFAVEFTCTEPVKIVILGANITTRKSNR
jgi:hypothetical protein